MLRAAMLRAEMLRAEMLRALNTACELRPLQVLTPHFPGRRQCGLHCQIQKEEEEEEDDDECAALYRCRHRRPSGARLATLL
jgi:hypothetical protein